MPEDVQNIGPHYDLTLMAWWENFHGGVAAMRDKYGDRFYRVVEVLPADQRRVLPRPAPQPVSGGRDAAGRAPPDDRALHLAPDLFLTGS